MGNVVSEIAVRELCSSCGVCSGVCPANALQMGFLENGDLVPGLVGECRAGCSLCLRVCPFRSGMHNPRCLNSELFGSAANEDALFQQNVGWHLRSVIGYSRLGDHRAKAASGGLATWCIQTLLAKGEVDRVAVVRFAGNGDRYFEFCSVSTADEAVRSAGSVYYPVDVSGLVRTITADRSTRWAVIGVPCLCSAIRNAPSLKGNVRFVLGLACGAYQNAMYTECLLRTAGLDTANVASINFRRKPKSGKAIDYQFVAEDRNGREGRSIGYRGLPFFLASNGYFRLKSCDHCSDVFAESADICFMDAWIPELMDDTEGTSLAVVRNADLNRLIEEGLEHGELSITDASIDQVVRSQLGQIMRKQVYVAARVSSEVCPVSNCTSVPWSERLRYRLQSHTRAQSKRSWARYGRPYGLTAFWLSIAHLVLSQVVFRTIVDRILPRLTRRSSK